MESVAFERACIVNVKIHGVGETVFEHRLHAYHQTSAERAECFRIDVDLEHVFSLDEALRIVCCTESFFAETVTLISAKTTRDRRERCIWWKQTPERTAKRR